MRISLRHCHVRAPPNAQLMHSLKRLPLAPSRGRRAGKARAAASDYGRRCIASWGPSGRVLRSCLWGVSIRGLLLKGASRG